MVSCRLSIHIVIHSFILNAASSVSQTIPLNCFILGQPTHCDFEIVIAKTAKVCALKKAIKETCSVYFDKIDAQLLDLWNVSGAARLHYLFVDGVI